MAIKGSRTKTPSPEAVFLLKREKAQNTAGGWAGTALWPGDDPYGRVREGPELSKLGKKE